MKFDSQNCTFIQYCHIILLGTIVNKILRNKTNINADDIMTSISLHFLDPGRDQKSEFGNKRNKYMTFNVTLVSYIYDIVNDTSILFLLSLVCVLTFRFCENGWKDSSRCSDSELQRKVIVGKRFKGCM